MNKYQEALEYINKKCKLDRLKFNSMIGNEMVSRIEELVDKETPMKVKHNVDGIWHKYKCSSCGDELDWKFLYCPYCGQALDWSDENDR